MIKHGLLEAEGAAASPFIHACLHLDREERSSASDLLKHPWLELHTRAASLSFLRFSITGTELEQ